MKNINYLTIIMISFLIASCSKITDPVKEISLGNRVMNYEADEKVDSLVIPPDLTAPSSKGAFTEVVILSDDNNVAQRIQNVEVKRDKYRRWLVVDLPPEEVWSLTKEFFRSYNFKIEKENQKIGILETDYLEIETVVPDKSLGAIRAGLAKVLQTQYGLPIADKYRVRIEPLEDQNKSEVYLTLSSIGEVIDGAMRKWQPREKDVELETEMLLTLMVFLGNDREGAIEKIQSNNFINEVIVSVETSDNGYASLNFPHDKDQSWRYLGWALDELNIDIEDRDSIEGSYFIQVEPYSGYFSRLLNTASSVKTYQLIVREVGELSTYIYFVDLEEEHEDDTITYSFELFNQIASKF
ncbi:outer membrane protein assembly factor BamC [Candidatus Thioglobus sp. NP1]|uniref:outer membrane protein assembly factor BamC n=1 Tax=Candidatus Thioglobus sp. NP1 TaxID=2508687 RepID=UPI000DED3BC0|nr:outer membrane protein assembly factor BamC [Candidatus Thioglobus sp. NP1]AXE62585.1 NlpBDapX lipoprotein [Candidatus Thioglobus sp. NP1]